MVHRGIPLSDLRAVNAKGDGIRKVPLRFCTASALNKEKHVDVTIKIFASISQKFPGATLVIAGDGEERQNLECLAKDLGVSSSVTFTGYLKRQVLFQEMAASDFFLFFSRKKSERLPNVVKEAMYAECVCFVSSTEGIEELIPGPDFGLIFAGVDIPKISREIAAAVGDESYLEEMRRRAKAHVVENFSSDSAMEKYVAIWSRPK